MLIENLKAILERYERDAEYHFIDTKLNTITGQNFYPAATDEEFIGLSLKCLLKMEKINR